MALFFLNWFLAKRGRRASSGTWKLYACHGVCDFVSNQAVSATRRRDKLLASLPSGLIDFQKDHLASSSGLSMKHCQDCFDLRHIIDELIRPNSEAKRVLDAILQPDKARSLLVFADEKIKPTDDHGLLDCFYGRHVNLTLFANLLPFV